MIRSTFDLLGIAARRRLHRAAESIATLMVLAALPPLVPAFAGMTWLSADRDERSAAVRRARQGAHNRVLTRQARERAGIWSIEVDRRAGRNVGFGGER